MSEVQDELSQWCEIDGHSWISVFLSHGFYLGPSVSDISRRCDFCKKEEHRIFKTEGIKVIPYNEVFYL